MVHWLGEGTNVMICLAREPPLSITEDPKTAPIPAPSAIFISHNYGDTFEDQTKLFQLNISGNVINSTVDQFITHPKFKTVNKCVFFTVCVNLQLLPLDFTTI